MTPRHRPIVFALNGKRVSLRVHPLKRLLDVLREDCGFTGTKEGCGEGECGACTVLVDGRPVQSCNTPLWSVEGKAVTTVEGLARGDVLGPVQDAFLLEQAAQCGYCTNGIIMTVTGLLSQNPSASKHEIVDVLDERHICRCGAQTRILKAIDRAIATIGGAAR